ncbi:two-component regulator propeller domain-containing protein [uncultured Draconibacterium sp.]|uniref:two-component regulator propeller domain-containing protein n=1 Tax=uncultured Draconibacterium sp. TaxID=1573823 RepID=UPI002AA8CCD6|nr:two-component regulator propeller domain-containing protein [uncultured Draconibacterium sp.]
MKLTYRLLLLLSLLLSHPSLSGSVHTFTKLSVENGLSNNEVNVIYKDSHGFIWFGTLHGLDRFDGIEIRSYAEKFPDQIENILSIEEDANKNLWIGTSEGLYGYKQDLDRFIKISLDGKYSITIIRSVDEDRLFLGTEKGLVIYNIKTEDVQHILIDTEEPLSAQNYITDILLDSHGSCWLATHRGLTRITVDDNEINNYYFESEYQEDYNSFTSLCALGNRMYLGTANKGIVEFNLNTKIFLKNNFIEDCLVTTISSDHREKLYIGTNGSGLLIFNLRTNQVERVEKVEDDPRSLSSNSVYSFLVDENQRLWIGTYSGGVNYSNTVLGGFQLHEISTDYSSINKSIRSFYFSSDSNYYFGTRNGFIHMNQDEEITLFRGNNTAGQLRSNIILTIYPFDKQLLIGTYGGGVSIYNPVNKHMGLFLNDDRFRNSNNYAFTSDNEGRLWVASHDGIYSYLEQDGRIRNYNIENSQLINNEVFYLTTDSENRLWIGTSKGFSVYNIEGDSLKAIQLPEIAENSNKVNYIIEDLAGNIWICTEIGGLYMINDDLDNFKVYEQKDGLPDNSVCSIIENSPGSFWISTLKGFCHFSLKENSFKNYSISDGLPGLVFSPAAVYLANDGQLWFGNEKGLMGFYPENVDENVVESRIVITNLYTSGQNVELEDNPTLNKPIEFADELILDHKSNNIGFRFVDLNYLSPYDNNYFVMLEGFDKEWQNNGNKNTIFYDGLKPGKYVFRVKNVVSAAEEAENSKELTIVVSQVFTRSVAFWVGIILIVVAISAYLYRTYTKLKKIQRKYIEEHGVARKYQSSGLSDKDLNAIVEKVKQYVKTEKVYLNTDIKLSEVAKELNMPSHHISQALNQVLDQGFSDFINKYRVREVRYLLENDAQKNLTLMAIARQCGFNSKTSFYRVFKKFTGKTPIDYIDSLKS